MFCILNAFIFVCTYFIFPETAGRSLEEMDQIFARSSKYNPYDVVRVERRTPRRYDRHGHPLETVQYEVVSHLEHRPEGGAYPPDMQQGLFRGGTGVGEQASGDIPPEGRVHPEEERDVERLAPSALHPDAEEQKKKEEESAEAQGPPAQ